MRPTGIIEPHDTTGSLRLHCDVVVVGSGAGGATVAARLAEAGHRVIILEEGAFFETAEYSADVPEMLGKLMRDAGSTVIFGKAPIPYFEGRCVGGTTVVNGGMCWRTPESILDEWVSERGLEALSPRALSPHFDEVERTIDARYQDPGSEGGANDVFRQGAENLGWALSRNKRNQRHCVGSNECITGCPSGAKRSTLSTWLPRFFRSGGELFTHAKVERLRLRGHRAVGVRGRLQGSEGSRRFDVEAKAVVLSCGAVQTPLLLQRNRLCRPCGRVGRHFTVHPNIKVAASFDSPVHSMRGTHQAWQCTEFIKEGILLAPGSVPLPFLTTVFKDVGDALARRMANHAYYATGGILVEDSTEGRIQTLPLGIPLIRYDVAAVDQGKFVKATGKLAELYFAAGAREVYTAFNSIPVLHSPDDIPKIAKAAPKVRDTEYFTAHIMGTCRMHEEARGGVVNPNGETWDVPGLFIADASVLPGPIGVNPQVTIMALAHFIACRIDEALARPSTSRRRVDRPIEDRSCA